MNLPDATPPAADLVLVGGGHAHALALRMLGMKPIPGVRLTLVSDASEAPYSGMLPGHVAGFYSRDEMHIDLRRLCEWAGACFISGRVAGIDPDRRRMTFDDRPPLAFDVVSINVGGTPDGFGVPGFAEWATPAKPVPVLLEAWERLCASVTRGAGPRQTRILIVGGGAGGVELALNMQARLERLTGDPAAATLKLVHGGDRLLPGHNDRVRRLLAGELEARGIEAIAGTRVIEVRRDRVVCAEGREFEADHIFWVANVTPPTWLGASGLRVDEAGFIAVAGTLQSLSHAHVFAAGDVAAVVNEARPKSGVFAVRAARPLVGNLRRFFAGRPLEPWAPQREFLSLIGTGRAEAVASRRFLAAKGRSMWWLKDWIDRRFMRRFEQLPEMDHAVSDLSSRQETPFPVPGRESPAELSRRADRRCLGCAAKIGASSLARVLERVRMDSDLSIVPRDEFLVGLEAAEDAAVFLPPPGRALVQTVDYLPALLSDLHLFGRIAALHCFSDIFAMGAEPHSALIAALVPFGADALREESLYQLISGAARELVGMGAVMMGGHSAENPLPGLSITANGLVDPTSILRKGSLVPGQVLVLTKPLGIGMIFAAHMRLEAGRACLDAAIESMLVSNLPASRLLRAHRASAATDVTGFGLLGHLLEMLRPSGARVLLELDALPAVRGALDCASRGHRSSLHDDNRRAEAFLADRGAAHSHPRLPLLYDPQTSGGLLATLPSDEADGCVAALRASGCPDARIIGRVTAIGASAPVIDLQTGSS